MLRTLTVFCTGILLTATHVATAATWSIDPAHSSVQFAVRHLMVSTVRGTFNKFAGTVSFDEANPAGGSVEATIDAASIDTREPKRDEHLRNADFLDVAKYPSITFKSKKVVKKSDTRFDVIGDLTLHGVTREVTLDVGGSPKEIKDPFGNTKLGGVAHAKLDRRDFGITWSKALDGGGLVVGNEISIIIDVELAKGTAK